ncbi:MAG: glycoside hydrolase family 5 protein, partial [Candidatus Neoclostridium sp.]
MQWKGHERGMGIGGWLTNYKRFNCIPTDKRLELTVGDYEHFDSYITEKDVRYIASLGFDHVRLGFDQIVVEQEEGVLRERTVDLIDRFIGWCEKAKLNVVLNLHKAIGNYCDVDSPVSLFESDRLKERFIGLWLCFARRYKNKSNVAFELLNEVRGDSGQWNELWQRTLTAIRSIAPQTEVVTGGNDWNNPPSLREVAVSSDPNLIYTFHMYYPHLFTHQRGVLQSQMIYYNREMPYPCDGGRYLEGNAALGWSDEYLEKGGRMDIGALENAMRPAFDFAAAHPDKRVWCGEFGTIRHAKPEWRAHYMNDVILLLKEHDMSYCVWNYLSTPNDGNRFSLV